MMLRTALFVSAALCAVSPFAQTQQVIFLGDGEEMVVMSDGPTPPGMPPAPAAAGKKDAGKASPRLEKLKKLEYDRRPSTILATWSKPPEPPAEEQKPAEEPAAAPAAAESTPPAEAAPDAAAPTPEEAEEARKKAEAAAKKKAEEEAKAKAAAEEAARKAAEAKAIEAEMAALQRSVTLGDWAAVKTYFAGLTEDERTGGYDRLLESLKQGPSKRPPNIPPQGQQYLEKNQFSPADVLGIADLSAPLTKEQLASLGAILRQALDLGHRVERFLEELRPRLGAEGCPLNHRQLALVLVGANEPLFLEGLLPTAEEAEASGDREALNLISRWCLAQDGKDKEGPWLEQAWRATLAALAAGEISEEIKSEAIQRAVDIAPRIQKDLGQAWLDESFTARPERGKEVLAAIGSAASTGLQTTPHDADRRIKLLELQTTAAKALLAAAPERADEWSAELSLLAVNWLREAGVTYQFDDSTSLGPRIQRDMYGNIFYYDYSSMNRRMGGVAAGSTKKVLDLLPPEDWLRRVDDTLQPRIHTVAAQLFLKVSEEGKAFPHIETLAATHPAEAQELVKEFLRVWANNHNPNSERGRTNQFMFVYGFDERANSIPLTRSKQERNLRELGECVARLRKLPVELPTDLLANAFTTAHSTAEIYRLETIEGIFGPMESLDPATMAELLQRMRANLVTVWDDPAVQKDKKTGRNQKDMQAEVVRGYELARATTAGALKAHPGSWELWLAQAALEHDQNDYERTLKKDPEFASRRMQAFETFAKAARLYAENVEALPREKETGRVHETWFYAALGASDLRAINHERQLAAGQIPLIRAALQSLPGERAERHMALFANSLVTRLGSVNPAVKFRYVREGLAITGETDMTREAQSIFDYYKDLVTEIQLRVRVDGSDRVGHAAPFGLCVDLRHTRDIERESGGFSKYLQNQNNAAFGFNYGRPTENYRDKFEEAAREALAEHFDVRSITFNEPSVRSKAEAEYGWRVTPYAYILLAPRGPQVDRVPPLRLDLDFLDTTGYALLPIESPTVPIDASTTEADARPYEKLALTQILDERQAKDGKLLLEVKASATGVVPEFDTLMDLAPAGFDVVKRDDTGVAVVKFAEEGEGVTTERTWTITLRAKAGLTELPTEFTFGAPRVETATHERFRYVDADLASVEPTVQLERRYGEPSRTWMWWIPVGVLVAAGAFLGLRRLNRPKAAAQARFPVPETVTPFTVLGLLRDIERNNGLAPAQKRELSTEIAAIERHFFGEQGSEAPDLRRIAESWAARTS